MDQKNVVLDTFKLAEPSLLPGAKVDGKTFIIRVYEAYGGRSEVRLSCSMKLKSAHFCNILEETSEAVSIDSNGDLCFEITPFQVIGIKAIIEV